MEIKSLMLLRLGFLVLGFIGISSAILSFSGIKYEVKSSLHDPYNVLENWDWNSVDPCSWRMVTRSPDGYASVLGLPSQSLSGTLSPSIGSLRNLQSVLLQNNAISGPIPATIGKLEKLQTPDLANQTFISEIPTSLGHLKNLNYLRLNNNSLNGACLDFLSNTRGLTLVFRVIGNPLICRPKAGNDCCAVFPEPLSLPPDSLRAQSDSGSKGHRLAVAFILFIGLLIWWRYRHKQQILFDTNGLEKSLEFYQTAAESKI